MRIVVAGVLGFVGRAILPLHVDAWQFWLVPTNICLVSFKCKNTTYIDNCMWCCLRRV